MNDKEHLVAVGKRIKERRNDLGMRQIDLAEKLGYKNKQMISSIENGSRNLTVDDIDRLSVALNVTPGYLVGSTEKHYEDAETAQIAQELKDNPNMRILFSASKGASAEALKQAADLLMFLKSRES